jgi:hypothetical protein
MSWSYSGDPGSSDRDAVRFLVGDTDISDQQLSDEEIDYLLVREGSVNGAALAAARTLVAKYARLVDKSVGDLSISYSQRRDAYAALIADLTRQQAVRVAGPVVGGISRTRKRVVDQDADRVEPSFRRDQFSYPGTADSDDDPLDE